MSTSRDHHARPTPGRDAEAFEALLGDRDAQLVLDGLYQLRSLKVKALRAVQCAGVRPTDRPFEPRDFGIPDIDRLLERLGADPAEHPMPPQER